MLLIAAVSSLVAATPALVENPVEIAYEQEQECCDPLVLTECDPLVLTEEEVLDSQAIVFGDTNVELEENSENPEVISDEDNSEKE